MKRYGSYVCILLCLLFISTTFFISCGGDNNDEDTGSTSDTYTPTDSDFQSSADVVKTVSAMTSSAGTAYAEVTEGTLNSFVTTSSTDTCPDTTLDKINKTLEISFESGCEVNEMPIEGFITGTFTSMEDQAFSVKLDFDGFSVDADEIDGTITLNIIFDTIPSMNLSCDITYSEDGGAPASLAVTDLSVTVDPNNTILNFEDDIYTLNGTGVYTDEENTTYNLTFTDVSSVSACYIPVSGELTIEKTSPDVTAQVDFGDGTCDTLVDVTIAGETKTIDLSQPITSSL